MELINSKQLCEKAEITYRQLDHWIDKYLITPVGDPNPGSGHIRQFDASIAKKVKLLGRVSRGLGGSAVDTYFLGRVYARYDDGFIQLNDGLILKWEVEEDG